MATNITPKIRDKIEEVTATSLTYKEVNALSVLILNDPNIAEEYKLLLKWFRKEVFRLIAKIKQLEDR